MSSPQRSSETGCWPGCISLLSPLPLYSCPQKLCTHRADWPRIQAAETTVKCSTNTQTERERKVMVCGNHREEEKIHGRTRSWRHIGMKETENGNAKTFISSVDLLTFIKACSQCTLSAEVSSSTG